jgi:hypothetical protein
LYWTETCQQRAVHGHASCGEGALEADFRRRERDRDREDLVKPPVEAWSRPSCPALWHSPTLRYHASCVVLFVWVIC